MLDKRDKEEKEVFLNGNSAYHTKKGPPKFFFILLYVFFGICIFLGVAEMVAAFLINTHILGFVFGALLFIISTTTLILTLIAHKRGTFDQRTKMIVVSLAVLAF